MVLGPLIKSQVPSQVDCSTHFAYQTFTIATYRSDNRDMFTAIGKGIMEIRELTCIPQDLALS